MAASQPPTPDVVAPEAIIADEVRTQLAESQKLRAEAEKKVERAEATAGEMSKILRRIAAAMDDNPRSWDELFERKRR